MQLKEYQKIAVDSLLEKVKSLLGKDGSRIAILKAPTGSGKTIMVADFLEKITNENLSQKLSFIWISAHNLHKQSRAKLEYYLRDAKLSFTYLEDVQDSVIKENEVVFINWEEITKKDHATGKFTNVYMRDNEQERNLPTFVRNTKEEGREIVLIVDESHYYYWSEDSQALINNIIAPKITLEVSATPRVAPSVLEDALRGDSAYVEIKFEDVVAEGMIKKEIIINEEFENLQISDQTADEVVVEASLKKRERLKKLYKSLGANVNPLVIIQLPSQSQSTSSLDRAKIEVIKSILKDKHNITVDNKKLAIWLSDEKEHLEGIENIDSDVEVLIFKQAIAIGWDCPRAQILVMFRETQSVVFEIQTVGRIIRMPEIKHYDNEELNKAYIFTNLSQINIKAGLDQGYFYKYLAKKAEGLEDINIPSVYLTRQDYGDITLSYRKVFMNEVNSFFGISDSDMVNVFQKKIEAKNVILNAEKLSDKVMSDGKIVNIDTLQSITGKQFTELLKSPEDIKAEFDAFAREKSRPYAPIRSYTKIQQSIYDWFDKFVGFADHSRLDIQKIVLHPANREIFDQLIERAKVNYEPVKQKELESRKVEKPTDKWNPPDILYYNDLSGQVDYKKHALQPAYMIIQRSSIETEFEKLLDSSSDVTWWFKNGTNSETFLGIKYFNSIKQKEYLFYPDFVVFYKDKSIGIFDTKAGETASSPETKDKAEALYAYVEELKKKGRKITGGIVIHDRRGWYVHGGKNYKYDTSLDSWSEYKS